MQNVRYGLRCIDIYDIPHYVEESPDGRGKNGFYKDRLIPLLINCFLKLAKRRQYTLFTTVTELSKQVGLVGMNYKNRVYESELKETNTHFSDYSINQLYFYCKPELDAVIFRALDSLQKDYSTITYKKIYRIKTCQGSHVASEKEINIIHLAEEKILKELEAATISAIFKRKIQDKFYYKVCKSINEEYGYSWDGYYKEVEIHFHKDELKKSSEQLQEEKLDLNLMKYEINKHLIERIRKKMEYDYNYTMSNADKIRAEWVKKRTEFLSPYDSNDENFWLHVLDADEEFPAPKPFRYFENYPVIMNDLINKLLALDLFCISSDFEGTLLNNII